MPPKPLGGFDGAGSPECSVDFLGRAGLLDGAGSLDAAVVLRGAGSLVAAGSVLVAAGGVLDGGGLTPLRALVGDLVMAS